MLAGSSRLFLQNRNHTELGRGSVTHRLYCGRKSNEGQYVTSLVFRNPLELGAY